MKKIFAVWKSFIVVSCLSLAALVTSCGGSYDGVSQSEPKSTNAVFQICRRSFNYPRGPWSSSPQVIHIEYQAGFYNPCTLASYGFHKTTKEYCDLVNLKNKISPPLCPSAASGGGGGGFQ